MHKRVHIVLPPRESCSPRASGAIALVVQDFLKASRYRRLTTVYGGRQSSVPADISYVAVSPGWRRWQSLTRGYARKVAGEIPDSPTSYIEIHNRVAIMQEFRRTHRYSRLVLYLHNDPQTIKGLGTHEARRRILEMADSVICVSEYVRLRFLRGLEADSADRVNVVFNAIDPARYPPPQRGQSLPRILYVGRIVPDKGVLQLAKGLTDILPRYPEWKAMFIGAQRHGGAGASPYEQEVRDVLEPLGRQVEWLGQIPHPSVQRYMNEASIVVSPSICTEAFSLVCLEAMANGCAVIGSGRGGMSEVMGTAGIFIDPESPADIGRAMEGVMRDPELLYCLQQEGYRYVCERFDLESQVRVLDDIRDRLLESREQAIQ